jgi:hypothetical protein
MVTFLTIMLGVSILGMASLLWLKRYELNSGRVFLGRARPAVGEFFHQKLQWLEYVLPGLIRSGLQDLYRAFQRLVHVVAAWVALRLEHGLERALKGLRRATALPKRRGEKTSAFLREVAEHKKKLQNELPDRSTIVEE